MFWKITALSPVEAVLDKENFTLEELLDEEEIIQECKALNSRVINFLHDRAQVEQLLRYVVEEPPEDSEHKRAFKFPFISCEIFTCEIDVILKTLVEEEELMNLLFSFLEPTRPHSASLAGYFSKVILCLMLRKTVPLMNYVQAHQDVFRQLVDLIGITSIMEVLIRLVGADDHMYTNFADVMQWLADSNLLEMIVDKLSPSCPSEVHANAAETLCAITRNPSSPLAAKLSSSSFVGRIFGHALEDARSRSGLVHSLSHLNEPDIPIKPETVGAMLPKLGDLLVLLNVSIDEKILPTTYGELRPPLGNHRLKIVEFIAVLLRTGNEVAEKELVSSGAIRRILDLFFEYPYNNSLHHHVESIIVSCLESKTNTIVDHLFEDCDLVGKILLVDQQSILSGAPNQPTLPAAGRQAPRVGNLGHVTRISNKLVQLGNSNSHIQAHLQKSNEWMDWQATVLQERSSVENVYRWACGRPTALQDRTRDSDEDELHDRDYDVSALANNLSQAFRYSMYENEDGEEVNGALDRDDEDAYFDDESAEVVISALRLRDDQESLFTNSNWFAFQEDRIGSTGMSTSSEQMDEINLNGTANGGSGCSDDEVVVGEDGELVDGTASVNGTSRSNTNSMGGLMNGGDLKQQNEKVTGFGELDFFRYESADNEDLFSDGPIPDWVGWRDASDLQVGGSGGNPFNDDGNGDVNFPGPSGLVQSTMNSPSNGEVAAPNGTDSSSRLVDNDASQRPVPSLFEEDVEFVGVELEGTEKAMEQALKEGIVGEAAPLKRNLALKALEKEKTDKDGAELLEFNDTNYWRIEQEAALVQE